ncbi:MAG: hypothetical protein O3A33_00760 [Chloroflexi bacterium]|nr:hypothetical protein [Chloroflexota bacterium]
MAIVRLYTGDDGQSHFEELTLDSHPNLTTMQAAKGVMFRLFEAGYFSDWHHAPQNQYVVTLSGEMEIIVGDGTKRRFGVGDVLVAEDTTGQGHTTAVIGGGPRLSMTVPLAD